MKSGDPDSGGFHQDENPGSRKACLFRVKPLVPISFGEKYTLEPAFPISREREISHRQHWEAGAHFCLR
jgi:hypothetical protein